MVAMSAALEFHEISKEYRNFPGRRLRALDDFTLQVETGEIFGFLGPNGAGKSTAIHLAMGFMLPSKGSGHLLGEPFGHARTRRRVGFLAENVALYHRRALRLVRFYGALNGLHGANLEKRSRDVLALPLCPSIAWSFLPPLCSFACRPPVKSLYPTQI